MSGLFNKLKGATSSSSSPVNTTSSSRKKDTEQEIEVSLLEKMLQNSDSKIRKDGSDKFFGMENALYYSVPFREHVISYPLPSAYTTPSNSIKTVPSIRAPIQSGGNIASTAKSKSLTAADAIKKRTVNNSGQTISTVIGQRPEDKPDSPEYKKKHALMIGPVLELTYENSSLYGMEESTFTALKDIFMALIESKSRTGVLSPQRFLEIFKKENEMFRTSMHQDAHEFYGLVLNSVISNVESKAKQIKAIKATVPDPGSNIDPLLESQSLAIKDDSGSGWVHEIFEGVLTSETKCLTCETVSQRDETFLDLSIDLDEHSSVTACLRKFSAEEMLCERNKFHCDNCGGLQEAERRTKIKRLPRILALHLKRFKYTEDMTRLQKLFHRVVYPYHLRMFNTTDDAEDPDRLYELYAVVVHIGGNAYHGHYVSVIKTQDRGWLLFDDEMVEPVDKHYAQNFFGDKPGMACAYVLFYQETSVDAVKKEHQRREGLFKTSNELETKCHDNGSSIFCSPTSTTLDSNIPLNEIREFIPLDDKTGISIPTLNKDQKVLEKKESKEVEKVWKATKKALAKDRKLQAKDRRRGFNTTKVSVAQDDDEQLSRVDEGLKPNTDILNNNQPVRVKQSSRSISISRKGFQFLGGPKNSDSRKPTVAPDKKLNGNTTVTSGEEFQISEKYTKNSKERFNLIALGRKKTGLSSS